jgi:hypothetical protein
MKGIVVFGIVVAFRCVVAFRVVVVVAFRVVVVVAFRVVVVVAFHVVVVFHFCVCLAKTMRRSVLALDAIVSIVSIRKRPSSRVVWFERYCNIGINSKCSRRRTDDYKYNIRRRNRQTIICRPFAGSNESLSEK